MKTLVKKLLGKGAQVVVNQADPRTIPDCWGIIYQPKRPKYVKKDN